MFLRNLSFIILLSSALRSEYPQYIEIECLAPVSLPRMTVKTPCSMLTLTTVLKDTSGEITDRQSPGYISITISPLDVWITEVVVGILR